MRYIEIFSRTDLESCAVKISRFVKENKHKEIYISANFNGYSDVGKLLDSVDMISGVVLLFFTDNDTFANATNRSKRVLPLLMSPNDSVDPRLAAKFFKVMPHKVLKEDVPHIWVDSNLSLATTGSRISDLLHTSSIAFFEHDKRVSVDQEYLECVKHDKDSRPNLTSALSLYDGRYPTYLLQGRVIVRKDIESTESFNEVWWSKILATSIRDQLTLPYALEKSDISFRKLGANTRANYVSVHFHNKVEFSHKSNFSNFLASLKNKLVKCVYRFR